MRETWHLWFSRLRQQARRVCNSIWFLPVLLLIGAIALFVLTTEFDKDSEISLSMVAPVGLLNFLVFTGNPSGARIVLGAMVDLLRSLRERPEAANLLHEALGRLGQPESLATTVT